MTEYVFTHDRGVASFDGIGVDGITTDDDGNVSFDWNEVPVVELEEPPHARAFDTDQFYKIGGATIARPIKQPYQVGDSVEWYKKPADELRDAAWSADNRPFPLTHPDTGMVKSVDDIHGFWRDPRYDDDEDRLMAGLYVPMNDDAAKEFIEEHQDVSPGFYNRIHEEYDGDTGDLTDDDVDGFQTDLYIDHIAGVKQGRCPSEAGCGLDTDAAHGRVVMQKEGPDFDTESDPRDCSCNSTMSNDKFDIQVDLDDVSLDSLAEQFDEVATLRAERDEAAESLDEVREDLTDHGFDVDDDQCPCEVVDDAFHELEELREVQDTIESIEEMVDGDPEESIEEMVDELEEYREDDRKEALDDLEDLGADRDEWEDESLDAIEEEAERRREIAENMNLDTKGLNTDSVSGDGNSKNYGGSKRTFGRGHAAGPQDGS